MTARHHAIAPVWLGSALGLCGDWDLREMEGLGSVHLILEPSGESLGEVWWEEAGN